MKTSTIYVADCDKNGGIICYVFENGSLTEKQKVQLDRPMYLATENNKLYCILREPFADKNSGILSFDILSDGTLSNKSSIISTEGKVCCHLCVKSGEVFDANYVSGSINKLGAKTVTHSGKGVDNFRQEAPHVHFTNFSPDGKYIFACDLGLDTIYVYDLSLHEISKARVPSGHGVRHLAYSKNTIYSVNELKSTISVFDYSDGTLEYVATVNGLPENFIDSNTAAAIKIDGTKLYVSHRGYDEICVFDISDKLPQFVTSFKSGGKSPRDFEIVDNRIIVTNEGGNLTVFDKESLAKLQDIALISPLCVIKGA